MFVISPTYFTFSPPFKTEGTNIYRRYVKIIPFFDGKVYAISFQVVDYCKTEEESSEHYRFIQNYEILTSPGNKLDITVRGVESGNIIGGTAELLISDIFINMVLNEKPEWVSKYFPDWDYSHLVQPETEPIEYSNNVINFMEARKCSKDK